MSLYGRIFAAGYDRMLADSEEAGLRDRRTALLAHARGDVLELGAGTGLNVALYPSEVGSLTFTEPEEPMAKRLEARVPSNARVVRAPAEELPFDDDSFDTVVATLVLCTVDSPEHALGEIARVLRPDGQFLFLEHVRSDDPGLARWQDRWRPIWQRVGHGCRCNRPTPQTIDASPLTVDEIEHGHVPKAPGIVRPMVVGRASVPPT